MGAAQHQRRGWNPTQMPVMGQMVDMHHPLAAGLRAFYIANAGAGTGVHSAAYGGASGAPGLVFRAASPTWKPVADISSPGLTIPNLASCGADAVSPKHLQLSLPITVVCRAYINSTGTGTVSLFGLYRTNTGLSADACMIRLAQSSSGNYEGVFTTGSTQATVPGPTMTGNTGRLLTFMVISQATRRDIYVYEAGGRLLGTGTASGAFSAPTWTTPLVGVGSVTGNSDQPDFTFYAGWVYNRVLLQSEGQWLSVEPFAAVPPISPGRTPYVSVGTGPELYGSPFGLSGQRQMHQLLAQ